MEAHKLLIAKDKLFDDDIEHLEADDKVQEKQMQAISQSHKDDITKMLNTEKLLGTDVK